jgi:hypothetical protein
MRISQLLLAVSSWPLSPVSEPSYSSSDVAAPGLLTVTPIPCLSPSPATIEDLVSCFEAYTVPSQHYTRAAYLDAQPQDPQLTAWKLAVSRLLAVDGSCSPTLLPAALNNIYKISAYTETSGKVFCVLSEVSATGGYYTKGWGFFAVPALRAAVSRFIHISAPHPLYDEGTVRQAAAVFKRTGAKSLLISGRHKNAYASVSCTGLQYSATDAAYDDVRLRLCLPRPKVVELMPLSRKSRFSPRVWQFAHGRRRMTGVRRDGVLTSSCMTKDARASVTPRSYPRVWVQIYLLTRRRPAVT